ncbi:MAG TPA: hypothetical protein VG755_34645 [Nannocystaceae bacterium]|nr:hypothetical protein [Nannocystaceae bacterium]
MTSLRLRLPFALLLVACPGSSDDEGGDTSGNTETASTTATTASTTMTTESSTTEPMTTAAETSSSEAGSTESTATAEESSTGGGDVCAPHDGDDACVACTRMNCCGQVMGCTNNPDCAAVFGCLAGINQPSVDEQMTCATDEGIDFNMVSAFLQQVYQCRMAVCAMDCPE